MSMVVLYASAKRKDEYRERPADCPVAYITTSTGFNNNTGGLGISVDVPMNEKFSAEGGIGVGSWGGKFFGGIKYRTKPCQRGWAFGLGLAYCTGLGQSNDSLLTVNGIKENVEYKDNPLFAMSLMAYKYFNIGKKYNRFYLQSGVSFPLGGEKITQISGSPIDKQIVNNIGSRLQSAPILAVGVSFGIQPRGTLRSYKTKDKKSENDEPAAPIQEHNVYADVAIPWGTYGFSVAYNYRFAKWFGIGAGVEGYNFYPTITNATTFVPAVAADMRFYIRSLKKNQFFSFIDLGKDFYTHTNLYLRSGNMIYHVPNNNGFYSGFGLGYFRRVTPSGWGPYISLKMMMNWYNASTYDFVDKQYYSGGGHVEGIGAISLGFKF